MHEQYRQGDVLVQRVRATKKRGKPIPRDQGRIILAYGESTGHAHAVCEPEVLFVEVDGERLLMSESGFRISHEEHSPIDLPGGTYRVTRQREYSPEAIRNVAD
jgi:hypothetical protein